MDKERAWDWITKNDEQIIEVSDRIWDYAELGLQEFKSCKLLANTLGEHGFSLERGVAGMPTAFVATYGDSGPVIGVMGEYDALPELSQKALPYKEPIEEGAPGHGCGHNIHGTSGMAGAIAIAKELEHTGSKGTVKFFGCPAEETYSGKVFMVRDGIFNGVDVALSHHPGWFNYGGLSSSLSMNSVKFHFEGVTSHAAASPDLGRSALDGIELMNIGINFMREHIVQEARIHYVIEKGGGQPNVVPAYARSWYYVRAPERDQVDDIYNWVVKIAEGAAMMSRTKLRVEFIEGCYNIIPNKALSELIQSNMQEIGTPTYTDEEMKFVKEISKTVSKEDKMAGLRVTKRPNWEKFMDVLMDDTIPEAWDDGDVMPGTTDVSDVSWVAPTMEFSTATIAVGVPYHTWQAVSFNGMSVGHKSLLFAAKTIAGSGIDLMTKPELMKKVKDEYKERMAGRAYKVPIPDEVKPPLDIAKEAASR